MPRHLDRDFEHVKKEILTEGAMVEQVIEKAITSLLSRRPELAGEVIQGDDVIDRKEVAIEEECLKMIALHQPVAGDLRFLITVLKVNNDLERMGDHAVNIAERAAYLTTHEPLKPVFDFQRMVEDVRAMVRESLDALVNQDTTLARNVCRSDEEVDRLNRKLYEELEDLMEKEPDTIHRAVQTLSVSRQLERIADLATNIAEDVVFMVEGDIVRHRLRRPPPSSR